MTLEFLQVAEAVAREKDVTKEEILEVMEAAIAMGARRKYGMDLNVEAKIDRESGDVILKKLIEAVETVMEPVSPDEMRIAAREGRDPAMKPATDAATGKPLTSNNNQMVLAEAKKQNPKIALGEFLMEDLPPMDFGRIAAQAAKQVIFQKVRDAERMRQFEQFKEMEGSIISGIVKRADYHGVLLDLGGGEAFIPREELIQREQYRQGDRVRGYIYKVERQVRGPQIWVSRTHPQFIAKLFEEEVPEIASGLIQVMGAARDPGFRAKVAVKSFDHNMDPVGACVGMRGVRVQAVTAELQGERVDLIQYSDDPAQYLVRAMAPAEVSKVVLDEENNRIEVVVPEDKLSLAIGRRGQNVRLASMLTGWDIDVMSEQEESERRQQEFEAVSGHFVTALDVDETLSRLLISEGFSSADQLLQVGVDELAAIEGLDEAVAAELQNRAAAYVNKNADELKKLKVEQALIDLPGMRSDLLVAIAKQKIITLDDFADLATDELLDMIPKGSVKQNEAEAMIMEARKHWFADEDAATEAAAATA